jgi:hypothetical protein
MEKIIQEKVGGARDIRHVGRKGPAFHEFRPPGHNEAREVLLQALPASSLIVSESLQASTRQESKHNFEVGSAMRGLCKLQGTEA